MFVGLILLTGMYSTIRGDLQNDYYLIPLAIGFMFHFRQYLNFLLVPFTEALFWFQQKRANDRQYRKIEESLLRQKVEIEENLKKQQAEVEAELLKRAEELRRKQEQFRQEQAQNRSQQKQQYRQPDTYQPRTRKEAYEILGVPEGSSVEVCKQAYKRLMSVYHPDKVGKLTGKPREEAERMSKLVGVAWGILKE